MELDERTKTVLETVYPDLKKRIIRVYNDVFTKLGFQMRATSGLRSIKEQMEIWKKGRDENGNPIAGQETFTNTPPGSSWHNYGLAVDSCFKSTDPYWEYLEARDPVEFEKRWAVFGEICKAYGLEWGGDFAGKDRPHAQLRYGLSMKEVQKLYKYGELRAVWAKVDQIRGVKIESEWDFPEDPEPPPAA